MVLVMVKPVMVVAVEMAQVKVVAAMEDWEAVEMVVAMAQGGTEMVGVER